MSSFDSGRGVRRGRSARSRRSVAAVVTATAALVLSGLTFEVPAFAATYPDVSITSPADGSTVAGVTSVSVTGNTDPAVLDSPNTLTLYVDGTSIGTYNCANAGQSSTCSWSFNWDATGLTGVHVLTASMTTTGSVTVASTPINVTADSPAPTVTIVSPTDGSTVSGQTSIQVSSAIDATQTDTPNVLTAYVDNKSIGTYDCTLANTGKVCDATFSWDATGLSGAHVVTAGLTTHSGVSAMSAPTNITISSPAPTVAITSPSGGAVLAGPSTISVTGTVDPSQTDYVKSITLYADGAALATYDCQKVATSKSCSTQFTWDVSGLSGNHVLTASVTTTNGVTASSAAVNVSVDNPLPTIAITSPVSGDVVSGQTTVNVASSVDASQTYYPSKLTFYVDGVSAGTYDCTLANTGKVCNAAFSWDATGLTGSHILSAKLNTSNGAAITSAAVTVTAVSPAPVVTVTSPTAASVVTGSTNISVTSAVDASQNDYPKTLTAYVDGVSLGSFNCLNAGTGKACNSSFFWDSTGLSGDHVLTAVLVTGNGVTVTSPSVTVSVNSPAPTVTVVVPANGGSVAGHTNVSVTATTDPSQTDYPKSVTLFVDGVQAGTFLCNYVTSGRTCNAGFAWDATGLRGNHVLTASVVTRNGVTATSQPDSVTVNNPPPTVTLNAVREIGLVYLNATASTDLSVSDSPSTINFYADKMLLGQLVCPADIGHGPCNATFTWNTAGLSGVHKVLASVRTQGGAVAASTPVSLDVLIPTRVGLRADAVVRRGEQVMVRGTAVTSADSAPIAQTPVALAFRAASGHNLIKVVRTDANGRFSYVYGADSFTMVTARVLATNALETSVVTIPINVTLVPNCSLSSNVVNRGSGVTAACIVPGLPRGSNVAVLQFVNGMWTVVAHTTVSQATFRIHFKASSRGAYRTRVVVYASKLFAESSSSARTLIVH